TSCRPNGASGASRPSSQFVIGQSIRAGAPCPFGNNKTLGHHARKNLPCPRQPEAKRGCHLPRPCRTLTQKKLDDRLLFLARYSAGFCRRFLPPVFAAGF